MIVSYKRRFKDFLNRNDGCINGGEVVLVKCSCLDKKIESFIRNTLMGRGLEVKDLEYQEHGLGEMGIPLAIKDYGSNYKGNFTAIAIRGKAGHPVLYLGGNGQLVKKY